MKNFLRKIKESSLQFPVASLDVRKKVLKGLAKILEEKSAEILAANQKDLKKMSSDDPLYDRLLLTPERIKEIAAACIAISEQEDVLNKILEERKLDSGLFLKKTTVPMGVIACIYEARPNVTVDIAALAIFTGNFAILKGSKSAENSNQAIINCIQEVLVQNKMPVDFISKYSVERKDLKILLEASEYVDLLIPRGGQGLIDRVRQESLIPTIETGAGVCHTFVDENADLDQAIKIIVNAKTQRPSVCNALDCLIVHEKIPADFFEKLSTELEELQVKIHADAVSFAKFPKKDFINLIQDADKDFFGKEFLGLEMSVKTVSSIKEAIFHINTFGSKHSEAILSANKNNIQKFFELIDASSVYANASTRFTDGAYFGLGAEVGISTQKLHARGPMGATALTTYKYLIEGQGEIRN